MRDKIVELILYWDAEFNLYEIEYERSRPVIATPEDLMLRVKQVVLKVLEDYQSSPTSAKETNE